MKRSILLASAALSVVAIAAPAMAEDAVQVSDVVVTATRQACPSPAPAPSAA